MTKLGITMGDPAGIGPEIILKALKMREDLRSNCIVFGSQDVLEYYNYAGHMGLDIHPIEKIEAFQEGKVNVVEPIALNMGAFTVGQVSACCGDAAFRYVVSAIDWAMHRKIGAVVTAPLNKEALRLSGHPFAGHTEIFREFAGGGRQCAMVLWSEKLKVIHASTHVSLRQACEISKDRLLFVIRLAQDTLLRTGYRQPRIAVAGLNPHAGENGLFGKEEIEVIAPAVQQCQQEGVDVTGPVPPDTVFLKAAQGQYDMVVAMYHDQGHIPVKLLAFNDGVNLTAGLPIVRTSVDHGTAFDIAGQGIADPGSLLAAIRVAGLFEA